MCTFNSRGRFFIAAVALNFFFETNSEIQKKLKAPVKMGQHVSLEKNSEVEKKLRNNMKWRKIVAFEKKNPPKNRFLFLALPFFLPKKN